jgi:gluconate kinase
MENDRIDWVIKVVGRDDLMLTLHETKESALKQCSELNRKFRDRFYVDEYHPTEEKSYESISQQVPSRVHAV